MKKVSAFISVSLIVLLIGCSNESGVKTTESGLKYLDEKPGEGREAKAGDLVAINFQGWIVQDSTDLFGDWNADSTRMASLIGDSYKQGKEIKFVLGENLFIKGTDEGIVGMKVGGARTIIIPSKLAYGEQGIGPIPPNTDIKIGVELMDVKDKVVVKMWDVDTLNSVTTESGLKYITVKEGEGKTASAGNVVTVNYSGYLEDGTKFDSSVEIDEPLSFVLGSRQVIPGWDEGISKMKKGGKTRFIIPPSLAYKGMSVGKIPPNSTLIFDVELLDIK
jgi:FKBP-type peptidyl-prolyl cis-trans isomerase